MWGRFVAVKAHSHITAPANTLRRAVQVVLDNHVSFDRLLHGSLALEDAIVRVFEEHEPDREKAVARARARLAETMQRLSLGHD